MTGHKDLRVEALTLWPGQHWCLFGGNGAGKSMLAALLCGRLTGGHQPVFADDFDPDTDVSEVSFAEQQRLWRYDDRHDVSEFNASAADAGTTVTALICGHAYDPVRLGPILATLDIESIKDQGIRFLSSGQIRRAMLARALYQQPRLLILDNPLESIDRDSAERISVAIGGWMSKDNCTLQMSRRQRDILPGITHLALMQNLAVTATGARDVMLQSENFSHLLPVLRQLPERLPAPCVSHSRTAEFLPTGAGGESLISLRGVSAAYGAQTVFTDLCWEMATGHHVLIEGPNGSGKSTLLSLLNGENHKAYGQPVYLFGRLRGTGETVWDVKSRFGVVSNELHNRYIKGWRVLDVVVSGFFDSLGLYDNSGAGEAKTARAWLQMLGAETRVRDFFHELSFGEQRLVLLARAMVKHPLILILDEPSVGLDDYHRDVLQAVLRLIAESGRTHIIYVSHDDETCPEFINQRVSFHKRSGRRPAVITVSEMPSGGRRWRQ